MRLAGRPDPHVNAPRAPRGTDARAARRRLERPVGRRAQWRGRDEQGAGTAARDLAASDRRRVLGDRGRRRHRLHDGAARRQ